MNVLVINGPNLNLLGIREPDLYGKQDYAALVSLVEETCAQEGLGVEVYQSNHEGDIVDKIQAALGKFDGIVINPAAYTHTSVAILDALKAVALPAVEVHISDVSKREEFRQVSYARLACIKTYMGLGLEGYRQAILYLKDYLTKEQRACPTKSKRRAFLPGRRERFFCPRKKRGRVTRKTT